MSRVVSPSRRRQAGSRTLLIVVVAAMLAALMPAIARPAPVLAAPGDGSIQGSGSYNPGFNQGPQSFSFSGSTSNGFVSGSFSFFSGSGPMSCLVVTGSTAVAGGQVMTGGFGGPLYVVFFVTDGGPDPADDTIHVNAMSNAGPPTCTETPDGGTFSLVSGTIVVDDGSAGNDGPATAVGSGTTQAGPTNTRTFDFDIARDASGNVTGDFSWSDPFGSSGSGQATCLRVIGSRAIFGGTSNGGPFGPNYTMWNVTAGGSGTGGSVAIMGLSQPPTCVELLSSAEPVTTGTITLTGGGGGSGVGEVYVAGDAQYGGFGPPGSGLSSIRFNAARNAGGQLSGRFSFFNGFSSAMGDVSCLRIDGPDLVLGGLQPGFGGGGGFPPPPDTWIVVYAHDGDLDGTADTVYVEGPSGMNGGPDCDAPMTGFQQQVATGGQITILDGPSDPGSVVAEGTSQLSSFPNATTRTFDIAATRTAAGAVSGTVEIHESDPTRTFTFSGTVVCVDIRGSSAFVVAEEALVPSPGQPFPFRYALVHLRDGGPGNTDDEILVRAYGSQPLSPCIDAATGTWEEVVTGDITVGGTPPPPPDPTDGLVRWSAPKDTAGLLAGVTYRVTTTNGFDLTLTDNDPNDREPLDGIVELELPIGASVTVCRTQSPAEWYPVTADCQGPVTIVDGTVSGGSFDHRFIPNLAITTQAPVATSVPRFGLFEQSFTLSRAYSNGDEFDPRKIDVTVTVRQPSGLDVVVPAFFTRDFTASQGTHGEIYTPAGGGTWRFRYSPDSPGTHFYTIRAEDKTQPAPMVVTTPLHGLQFTATTASSGHGKVIIDQRDARYLRFEDLTPYYPLGHNLAFEQGGPALGGTAYYEALLDSFEAADENWTRVWMTDFNASALEWSSGHWSTFYSGAGRYSLQSAWRMDRILELAEERGIQLQLVLNDHGQLSTHVDGRWSGNPYNTANGGPAADPAAFFTNAEAKRLFKQRLRYLVARYSGYRNLLAWELINEAQFVGTATNTPENTPALAAAVNAWHSEMAAYLRDIDPYDHLITSSSSPSNALDAFLDDPNLDLVQVHDYGPDAGRDQRHRGYILDLQEETGKATHIAEFGIPGQPECEFDPTTSTLPQADREHLSQGTHLHNAAWTAAMSVSHAASWWWGCYLHSDPAKHRTAPDFPVNERVFPPLAAYLAGEDLANLFLEPSTISASPAVVAFGMSTAPRGYVWVRDALNAYGSGSRPGDLANRTISGETIAVSGGLSTNTPYDVQVWDTRTGQVIDSFVVRSSATGVLTIPLPDFQRDIALKFRWGETAGGNVPPGGSVSTDVGNDGAWPGDPVELTLTSPNGGNVSIGESVNPINGDFVLLGTPIAIHAPNATAASPLRLTFLIDPAAIPAGDSKDTIAILRNGTAVPDCLGSATASPDPCITVRGFAPTGDDIRIVVLTSQASDWHVGVPAPVLGAVTGGLAPVAKGTSITLTAALTDRGALTGHTAVWDWGDGTTSAGTIGAVSGGSGQVSGSRTYAQPGVYTVSLTVTDPSGQDATREFRYVVVYDPSAGFATGGGSIVPGGATSDPGDLLPGLDGTSRAEFGFVVKYKKGATNVPEGDLTFGYAVGAFEMTADAFQWLVVTNDNWARFQGMATVAGRTGLYPFKVEARDGDKQGGKDRFVIKIWAPGADPATAEPIYKASGDVTGQVTIHRK